MCHSLFHLWSQNSFPDICRRILQRNPSHPWQYFPVAGLFNSALYTISLLLWPELSILSMTYPPQHVPEGNYGPSHALWQSGWLVGFLHFSCNHTPHTLCISYLSLSNTLSGLKQHLCHPVFVGKEWSVIRWIVSGSGLHDAEVQLLAKPMVPSEGSPGDGLLPWPITWLLAGLMPLLTADQRHQALATWGPPLAAYNMAADFSQYSVL